MLAQSVPWGVNPSSPLTLLVAVVVLIVLALSVSTRRANTRSRPGFVPPAAAAAHAAAPSDSQAGAWTAAQALFLEDPRAGCAWAEALAAKILRDRELTAEAAESAARRYGAAAAAVARGDATTDDLRRAFVELRSLYDAVSAAGTPLRDA